MKYILLAAFLVNVILLICGCNKATPNSTSLEGEWELRSMQAGMIPTNTYPAGNGNEIHFSGSTYKLITKGQQVKSGSYTVENDNPAEQQVCLQLKDNEYTNRIIYDNDRNAQKIFLQIKDNRLTFVSGCFALDDGSSKTYERKK